jgi:hypothetical protein
VIRLLRFIGVALVGGAIFGAVAGLFSSLVAGIVVGLVVGLFILGATWIFERWQARALRAGDRVVVDMGFEGEAKGVIEKLWGPEGKPTARVRLPRGATVDVEVDQLVRARR